MAEIGTADRRRLEAEGDTAYGTSYPIRNCSDLRNAIKAYGRAPKSERAKLRRFIARRRRELGCTEPLPSDWHVEHGGEHVVIRAAKSPKHDSEPTYKVKPRGRKRDDEKQAHRRPDR